MERGSSTRAGSWFQEEGLLLAELRRGVDAPPVIPGYDGLREIRRGGQGVVYRGVQKSTRRGVAVKVLLDASTYSASGRRRFEREVDLAAGLRHPGVVQVYDSGTTPEGRAYLVMEFVEGLPLDEALVPGASDARRVLETMAKVCDAVQYAHSRGVIHRDLKPSNIRVDRAGEPRVLDFGLAKAPGASPGDSAAPEVTTTGQFVGSLPWASPEQARGEAGAMDTRSDVYALGAVTYQLLTGRVPVDVSGGLHRALAAIVGTPPTPARQHRPSLGEAVEVVLDKALRKDPGERYRSAADLGEDLRRAAAGEPIAAQRESTWRTLRRTARRYRTIAWASGVAAVLVGGAAGVAARSAVVATRERDAANRARAVSDASVAFIADILGSASPDKAKGGREARVVDRLDEAAAKLPEAYRDAPETAVALHDLLGQTYSKLELWDQADAQFVAAVGVIEQRPGAFPDPLVRLSVLGSRASLMGTRGRDAEARALFERVIGEYAALGITKHANLATCWSDLGVIARRGGRLDEADRAYAAAMEATPPEGTSSVNYAVLLSNRALLLEAAGKVEAALPLMEGAVARVESALGADSLQTIAMRGNLAYLYITAGKPERGVGAMEQSLAAAERSAGESNTTTLILMNNLGKMYQDQGRCDRALPLYERAIRVREAKGDLTGVAAPMVNAIACLNDLGRSDEALPLADALLERTKEISGEASFDSCNAHHAKGATLERLGRPADAEPLFREAVRLSGPEGGILPAGHWRHDLYRAALGNNLFRQGRLDEAATMLPDAYEKVKKGLGENHAATRRVRANLDALAAARAGATAGAGPK